MGPSHTPQLNGAAERYNPTLFYWLKPSLKHSCLHHKFWTNTLDYGVWTTNRSPTHKNVGNMTPYKLYTRQKPSLNLAHVFGCRGTYLLPRANSGKLDIHSCPCIYLGVLPSNDGYKVYDIKLRRLVKSHHTAFHNTDVTAQDRLGINKNHNVTVAYKLMLRLSTHQHTRRPSIPWKAKIVKQWWTQRWLISHLGKSARFSHGSRTPKSSLLMASQAQAQPWWNSQQTQSLDSSTWIWSTWRYRLQGQLCTFKLRRRFEVLSDLKCHQQLGSYTAWSCRCVLVWTPWWNSIPWSATGIRVSKSLEPRLEAQQMIIQPQTVSSSMAHWSCGSTEDSGFHVLGYIPVASHSLSPERHQGSTIGTCWWHPHRGW